MRGGPPVIRRLAALDGIRGVLVIFLLCFHFGFSPLRGAWLTLNVFFVLSGFLIVRLLVQQRARMGRIDFLGFYARRARRLFPALGVLLAAIMVYGFVFAPGEARGPLRWDVLAAMGYFMNWRLIAQSNQYFVQFAEPSVLQHTWSLSVEEQFYLVVPVMILLLMHVLRTRRTLIAAFLGLAAVSAGWMAIVGVGSDFARSHLYYGTDTRAQSLLLGAALGVWTARLGAAERPNPVPVKQVQIVGWVAFAVTVAGFVLATPQTTVMADGGMFALSVAAVAWVWVAADERGGPVQRVLSVRPLAALGRISYGAYLWHWPIGLWLGQIMPQSATWVRLVLGFVLTIGVATISYQRIEQPIHDRGWRVVMGGAFRARSIAVGCAAALFLGAVGLGAGAAATSDSPADLAGQSHDIHAIVNGPVPDLVAGQRSYESAKPSETIAVYGDSVPYRLAEDYPSSRYAKLKVLNAAVSGCDLLPVPYVNPATGVREKLWQNCTEAKRQWPAPLVGSGAKLLLLFPSWLLAFPHELDGKARTWGDPVYTTAVTHQLSVVADGAQRAKVKVAVVTASCFDEKTASSVLIRTLRSKDPVALGELRDPHHINDLLRAWAARRGFRVLDLESAVCGTGNTPKRPDGRSLFADGVHYSPWGAAVVWKWLVAQVRQVEEEQ